MGRVSRPVLAVGAVVALAFGLCQAAIDVEKDPKVEAPQLTDEQMDAMFNFKMLEGSPDKMEGTLARMIIQHRLAALAPHLKAAELDAVPEGPERSKAQLALFVQRTTAVYLRTCMLHTILCVILDHSQLPPSDQVATIRAFAAYSYAQYAVAAEFLGAGELVRMERRLGVKGYEAMCSLMARVPKGGNADLAVQREGFARLMKTMQALHMVSNYTVSWQKNAASRWNKGESVSLDIQVHSPCYAEFNIDLALKVPGFYQDLIFYIIEAHFDAYQVEVDRQVTRLDIKRGIHGSHCKLSKW